MCDLYKRIDAHLNEVHFFVLSMSENNETPLKYYCIVISTLSNLYGVNSIWTIMPKYQNNIYEHILCVIKIWKRGRKQHERKFIMKETWLVKSVFYLILNGKTVRIYFLSFVWIIFWADIEDWFHCSLQQHRKFEW